MIDEAIATAWFAVHPLTRTMANAVYIGVLAYIRTDYKKYKAAKDANPDTVYDVRKAIRMALSGAGLAALIAVGPEVAALISRVLGGGVLPPIN